MYFKHTPVSKRKIIGEQGKNRNMKEKLILLSSSAVLATLGSEEML